MRRAIAMVLAGGLLCAPVRAQQAAAEGPSLESLTIQAVNLDSALRRTRDPAARKRLLGELEKVRHQMGPYDSKGKRITCQAMWHDTALRSLEREVKRLPGRPAGSTAKALVADARLDTRRMAAACLTRGWQMPSGTPKYQVDVFGQYLTNNIRMLDNLFERLSDAEVPEARADPAAKAALAKARSGIDQMGEAAKRLAAAPPETLLGPALAEVLGQFVQGLAATRDAALALGQDAPAPANTTGEADTPAPAEAPPMTGAEKARIAEVKQVAARLEDDGWTPVSRRLERFAAAVQAGFAVASARPQAREFLGEIAQAADLARSLHTSKVLTPEHLAVRQAELAAALEAMQSPLKRAKGFATLKTIQTEDQFRQRIETAGLTDEAARGLVQACYVLAPALEASAAATDVAIGTQLHKTCRAIGAKLLKMQDGPPKGTPPQLADCYKRQAALFKRDVEQAGLKLPGSPAEGVPLLASAVARANDLGLIVRAAGVLDAVKRYRPERTAAVTARLARAAQDLVAHHAAPAPHRAALSDLVKPFEDLAAFPLPAPAYRRVLSRMGGRAYTAATRVLSRELTAGIDAAGTGNPAPLQQALRTMPLFALLQTRAAAETAGLPRAGTANLVTFSVPEKVWKPFAEELDKRLRVMLADYARTGDRVTWLPTAAQWYTVYRSVVAGQRRTLDAHREGESELDFLVRNLERVAVPHPPDARWYAWRVGYHVTEATVTMNAGLDAAAAWHRDHMGKYTRYLEKVELDPDRAAQGAAE